MFRRIARSQSHRTDQGSSKAASSTGYRGAASSVAIPPYRSGKFQALILGVNPKLPYKSRNPTVQIREVPSMTYPFGVLLVLIFCRNPTVQIREVPSVIASMLGTSTPVMSQSHRTDQGSSKDKFASKPLSLLMTVAIPPYRSGKFQVAQIDVRTVKKVAVAIPPYRSGKFQGKDSPSARAEKRAESRNPTVQIREVPSPTAPPFPGCRFRSRNPTVQIREVPRITWRAHQTRKEMVAIPPYRSGKFQGKSCRRMGPEMLGRNPTVQIREVPRARRSLVRHSDS